MGSKLTSPGTVRKILNQYGFRLKKRFGQNFLVDYNILQKIVAGMELEPDQYVLEIGAGLGTLTQELAGNCHKVISFEIDRDLAAIFQDNNTSANVDLVTTDALAADWEKILRQSGWQGQKISLAANLPYYITSPLIMKACTSPIPFSRLVLMVQKEVAERIRANPGSKEYGLLTLAVEYYASVEFLAVVPKTVFFPMPDVDSALIRLSPRRLELGVDEAQLFAVLRSAFGQRRKTLKNALKNLTQEWDISDVAFNQILQELNLRPDVRGEVLTLADFRRLTEKLTVNLQPK